MTLFTDPDYISYQLSTVATSAAVLTVDTSGRNIYLTPTTAAPSGEFTTDGITIKCVYSKIKEIWKNDNTAIKYPFPMTPITDECYELINGWNFGDLQTKQLIRTGGWALKSGSTSLEEWTGIVSLGSIGETDQVYYMQTNGSLSGSPTNIVLPGAVNQAVQVYGASGNGNLDYRSYLKLFVREQAKSYASASLTDIGVSNVTYQAYRFPLANASDLKITNPDISAANYGVTITWSASATDRLIGSTNYPFHVIIDGNNQPAEKIYEGVQYYLRQLTDIDSGSGVKTGKITNDLLQFVGDTLETKLDSTGGVYIDNFQVADTNRLTFVDDTGTKRTFPYVAALTLNIGSNLYSDPAAIARVFFTTAPSGADFGTTNAIIVNDNTSVPMSVDISGQSSITFTFNYDGNVQGGRTAATDANVTAVAIGLNTGQYVSATGTITRSTANSISLVAALERNYLNS